MPFLSAILSLVILLLRESISVSLTASVENTCPHQVVDFTCSALVTGELRWSYQSEEALFIISDPPNTLIRRNNYRALLTESVIATGNLRDMTSVLSTTVLLAHNGSAVTCSDGSQIETKIITVTDAEMASAPRRIRKSDTQPQCKSTYLTIAWDPPHTGANTPTIEYTVQIGGIVLRPIEHTTIVSVSLPNGLEYTAIITPTNCLGPGPSESINIRTSGCGNPIPPALGFIMSQASDCTSVGSTTSYQCSAGLVPQDVKSSECISDGTWSPDPSQLICFANCDAPHWPENGYVHPHDSTIEKTEIVYQCNMGFLPQETRVSICSSNGAWIPDPRDLQCKVDCKAPGVPSNGTLESYFQTSEGSVVIYKCVHGLFPRERFKSVCTPAGTWEPDPTQLMCRDPVDCGPPDPPANGSLIRNDSTLEGTRIYYECNDGLLPNGHAIAVCNSKEMWTPPLTCREPAYCGEPVPPSNGVITNSTLYSESSVVSYRCRGGLLPLQEIKAECTEKGTWEPDPAKLLCVGSGISQSVLSGSIAASGIIGFALGFSIALLAYKVFLKIKTTKTKPYSHTYEDTVMQKQAPQTSSPNALSEQAVALTTCKYDPVNLVTPVPSTRNDTSSNPNKIELEYEYVPRVQPQRKIAAIHTKTNVSYVVGRSKV